MNTFRQMILSNAITNIVGAAISLIILFIILRKRSSPMNIFFGIAIVLCAIFTVVFSIQAYQLSY